jgi:biotin carboxyl carrier protein
MTAWVELAGTRLRVELPADAGAGGTISCVVDGVAVIADACVVEPGVLSLIVAGRQYRCTLDGDAVVIGGHRFPFALDDPRSLRGRRGAGDGAAGPRTVKAPMPGRIVRVLVSEGDEVAEQQGVIVIEAMKMQNELKAPRAGRVARIAVAVDATVGSGETLIVIE